MHGRSLHESLVKLLPVKQPPGGEPGDFRNDYDGVCLMAPPRIPEWLPKLLTLVAMILQFIRRLPW